MKAIDVLKQEHRVIERVLRCLAAAVVQAMAGGEFDGASIRRMVEFFREFADRCHHGKEETRLFPLLQKRGIARDEGPIGVMLAEHEQCRRHVQAIRENLGAAECGDAQAKSLVFEHARHFIQLLSEHIQKEDGCLFPMADSVLTSADQQALTAAFEKVEREEMGEDAHAKLHALADELGKQWNMPLSDTPPTSCCCKHS